MAAAVSSPITAISMASAQARRGKQDATKTVLARSGNRVSINNNILSKKAATSPSLSSSAANHEIKQVFEDGPKGIVCYRDESGEVTCEGYDEGPRFCPQFSRFSCNPRDSETIDHLQKCWLQRH
ncbi:unnamed protein product [Cuscuta campestris]|uniref:Uncharacterized protein n=1 Tax=Cuscuta campestris TaxID=132261 RepID=A0A484M4P3_9ASTE|nr:unnamed protein product [Cuscuta campestris]